MARNSDPIITAHALALAVTAAQRLATAEGRAYCVTRPPRGERPLVEPLGGIEAAVAHVLGSANVLIVAPQGAHHGMTPGEIVAAERAL